MGEFVQIKFIVFIQFCVIGVDLFDLTLNDDCIVDHIGENGICKFVNDCPRVIIESLQSEFPTLCGFDNTQEIVCCPNEIKDTPIHTQQQSNSNRISAEGGNDSMNSIKSHDGTIIEIPSSNRTSSKKCQEYYNILLQNLTNIQDKQNHSECPISIPNLNSTDDVPYAVSAKEFPHMALVGFNHSIKGILWACGGSLISEYYVLTAAHCLHRNYIGDAQYVLLGDLNYESDDDDDDPHRFNIAERITHPDYQSKYSDIGLLRLESVVSFSEYIHPICLPDTSSTDIRVIFTGWGKLGPNLSSTTGLKKIELNLVDYERCNAAYNFLNIRSINQGIINDTQICAESQSNYDTCQGDSGGPLQMSHKIYPCMHTVIGLSSFGRGCASIIPSVHTRVFGYIDWIENIVWPN